MHGPEALGAEIPSAISRAARFLKIGDEGRAQHALDTLCLTVLSEDGAALMKAVAGDLGIVRLSLPVQAGPRTWNARGIAEYLPLFKEHVEADCMLAKGGAWEEEKHPRWPAGTADSQGGRFAPSVGSGGLPISAESPDPSERLQTGRSVGRFKIPDTKPLGRLAYAAVKEISRGLQAALKLGLDIQVHSILLAIESIQWLNGKPDYYSDEIKASLDEPRTLKELQDAVDDPKPGYQIHHIVEQKAAEKDGFSREEIDARDNLVRIPAMKHREITAWYQTPNEKYGWLSPRQYLRSKDWKTRYEFGRQKLIDFGVLKP